MKNFLKIAVLSSFVGVTMASAALAVPVIDTADFLGIAGAVLAATGVFFGIRKALGLLN